MAVSNAVIK